MWMRRTRKQSLSVHLLDLAPGQDNPSMNLPTRMAPPQDVRLAPPRAQLLSARKTRTSGTGCELEHDAFPHLDFRFRCFLTSRMVDTAVSVGSPTTMATPEVEGIHIQSQLLPPVRLAHKTTRTSHPRLAATGVALLCSESPLMLR